MAKINAYDEKLTVVAKDLLLGIDSEAEDPDSSDATVTFSEETISAKVQADLFDNDTATTSAIESDLLPIEQSGSQNVITPQNLMMQMKGGREYRFAIRQTTTETPAIFVKIDDFGLESPLSCADTSIQYEYEIDISYLDIALSGDVDMEILNNSYLLPIKFEIKDDTTIKLTTHEATTADFDLTNLTSVHGAEVILREYI